MISTLRKKMAAALAKEGRDVDLNDVLIILGDATEADIGKLDEVKASIQKVIDIRDKVRAGKMSVDDLSQEDAAAVITALQAAGVLLQVLLQSAAFSADIFNQLRLRHQDGQTGLDPITQGRLDTAYKTAVAERVGAVDNFLAAAEAYQPTPEKKAVEKKAAPKKDDTKPVE